MEEIMIVAGHIIYIFRNIFKDIVKRTQKCRHTRSINLYGYGTMWLDVGCIHVMYCFFMGHSNTFITIDVREIGL